MAEGALDANGTDDARTVLAFPTIAETSRQPTERPLRPADHHRPPQQTATTRTDRPATVHSTPNLCVGFTINAPLPGVTDDAEPAATALWDCSTRHVRQDMVRIYLDTDHEQEAGPVWQLDNSRKSFTQRYKQPRGKTFWGDEFDRLEGNGLIPPAQLRDFLVDWDPWAPQSRANCPMLAQRLDEVRHHIPHDWQKRANQLYVGWVQDRHDADPAETTASPKGAYIAIDIRYALALAAVQPMGEAVRQAVDMKQAVSSLPLLLDIRQSRETFTQLNREGFHPNFAQIMMGTRQLGQSTRNLNSRIQDFSEAWIIAHEIGHQALNDRAKNPRPETKALRNEVSTMIGQTAIATSIAEREERDHLHEFRADVFGLMLLSGHWNDATTPVTISTAAWGAISALVAIGCVTGDWTPGDTHPSPIERICLITHCALHLLREQETPARSNDDQTLTTAAGFIRATTPYITLAPWLADSTHKDLPAPTAVQHMKEISSAISTSLTSPGYTSIPTCPAQHN